jgi:hypothetical protein
MLNIDKKEFDKNGFVLVKGLFSVAEITELRKNAYKQFEEDKKKGLTFSVPGSGAKYIKGDLLSKSFLKTVILDERIIAITKSILGDDIVYFGDSAFQIGTGLRGYHRDNIDRVYNQGPDWEEEYSIIRFGLYMQDHKNYSGGLKVRIGSHNNETGKSVLVDTEPGDVVFWSLRTLHSGNAVRLKFLSDMPVDIGEKYVPEFLKKDEATERVACFFSFGKEDKHLQRYISEYMQKTEAVKENLRKSFIDKSSLEELAHKGVKLIKPTEEYGMIS